MAATFHMCTRELTRPRVQSGEMNKDTFDMMLDVSLKHVGNAAKPAKKYKLLFEEMSYYFMRSSEGDDVMEEAFALMREHGLVDEDNSWIHKEKDNE